MINGLKNKIKKLLCNQRYELITCGKKSFKFYVGTSHEEMRASTFHTKEPEMLEWVNSFSDNSVFYDIGANVGVYSLYAAMNNDTTKIYSFEPESQNFSRLCSNIYINKFTNVKPYQIGISDKCKFEDLNIAIMESGAGAATLEESYLGLYSTVFQQGIFSIPLDDLVFQYNFPIPKYIKIDVDGIEEKILYGSEKVLSSNDCEEILVELNYVSEEDNVKVFNYLEKLGFQLKKKSDWTSNFGNKKSKNFIFKKL